MSKPRQFQYAIKENAIHLADVITFDPDRRVLCTVPISIARLISAAPEMLEQLKLLYQNHKTHFPHSTWITIEELITRAEGKE